MCAINPKFSTEISFKIYTAHGTKKEFADELEKVLPELLELEQKLNTITRLRWHICTKEIIDYDSHKTRQ